MDKNAVLRQVVTGTAFVVVACLSHYGSLPSVLLGIMAGSVFGYFIYREPPPGR